MMTQGLCDQLTFLMRNAVTISYNLLMGFNPFPHIDAFLTPLQHTTYENMVTKGEIAQKVISLLLPQFSLLSVIIPAFIEIF